jgi:hypothetical protein
MHFLDVGWTKIREGEVPEPFKRAWTRRGWVIGLDESDTFVVIDRMGYVLAKFKSINLDSARRYADSKIGAPYPSRKDDMWWWRNRDS